MGSDLVLAQGLRETRHALAAWRRAPGQVLGPWVLASSVIAVALLVATGVVAAFVSANPDTVDRAELTTPGPAGDLGFVLMRNALVLTLHALVCVAGFIAKSSLPYEASVHGEGRWVRLHDRIGAIALAFVGAATLFSLGTQALVVGQVAADTAAALGTTPARVLLSVSLHALPELTALFLPLAAWLLTSRRGRWDELLAATLVTVALAVPVLIACSVVEVWVTPLLLR